MTPQRAGGTTLLVVAKEPVPGRVKTRLTARYTPHQAALLAEAALADTLAAGLRVPALRRVLVLDGEPGGWLPPRYEVVPQVAGGLDVRLAAAFAACDGPALLVGMDTPHLRPAVLARAFGPDAWRTADAYVGPAEDGGFWALGLARPRTCAHLLLGVPMSTPHTGAAQRARLTAAGLRITALPALRDVDTPADAAHVAALAPTTRFARTLAGLTVARVTQLATPARALRRPSSSDAGTCGDDPTPVHPDPSAQLGGGA